MAEATQAYHKRDLNSGVAIARLARQAARKAVKCQLQAQGIKPLSFSMREIIVTADAYLRDHPELIAEARQRCAKFESDAQALKARKSKTSAVQISGSKLEG